MTRNPPSAAARKPSLAAVTAHLPIRFTRLAVTNGDLLTKTIGLAPDGSLAKSSHANMSDGTAEWVEVANLADLAKVLDALTPQEAVAWGTCDQQSAVVVLKNRDRGQDGVTSRTKARFSFPSRPAILFLDHDGNAEGSAMTAEEIRDVLVEIAPALADVDILARPSASAGLQKVDGAVPAGSTGGVHLYLVVADGSRVKEIGEKLSTLLWAAGHGWIKVGGAGQKMKRSLIDASVWSPERIDYTAAPILRDGLARVVPASRILPGKNPGSLLSADAVKVTAAQKKAAAKNEATAKAGAESQARAARAAWAEERKEALAKAQDISEPEALRVLESASGHAVLLGDFLLTAEDGEAVSVKDVLDNPGFWNGKRFADPLMPGADRRVAWANLASGASSYVWSHAGGGVKYELLRQMATVEIAPGKRDRSVDETLAVMRAAGDLYDYGEANIARVMDGRIVVSSSDWLLDYLDRHVSYFEVVQTDKGTERLPVDTPTRIVSAIMSKNGERGLRPLAAITTAPTLRSDGTVVQETGYDSQSKVFYFDKSGTNPKVPLAPAPEDAVAALDIIWTPLCLFPFVDDTARGVALAGAFTAVLRSTLATAPGIALDAPAAGTGKTKLALAIGMLATGESPTPTPPPTSEDEMRKNLFARLLEGRKVILFDNAERMVGGASLNAFLTAPMYGDRKLGESQTQELPNRALVLFTGNNITITTDANRRVLRSRLDAHVEAPYLRVFDFDPVEVVREHRLTIVVAVLTIIRAWITAGRPVMSRDRAGSFEAWDDLVRQPLLWVASLHRKAHEGVEGAPDFGDPMDSVAQTLANDPAQESLAGMLSAVREVMGEREWTVAEMVKAAGWRKFDVGSVDGGERLHELLLDISKPSREVDNRRVGEWLRKHKERIAGGWAFVVGSKAKDVSRWMVAQAQTAVA